MNTPDYQHPLPQLVDTLLARDGDQIVLDDASASALEEAILAYRDDPRLRGALLALFSIAEALHHQYGSLDAAAQLLAVLGRAGRALFPSLHAGADVSDLVELVGAGRRDLSLRLGQAPLSARLDAPPPEGAVKASSLDQVQRARMGIPPPRNPKGRA